MFKEHQDFSKLFEMLKQYHSYDQEIIDQLAALELEVEELRMKSYQYDANIYAESEGL